MSKTREVLEAAIADGVITREEHDAFIEAMHADGEIDEEEHELISGMFRLIQQGKLTVVDDERERADLMRQLEAQKAAEEAEEGGEESEEEGEEEA
jgi:F0F1-type ATP synthase epsilon subunit